MKAHVCEVCGYVYDQSATGVPFEEMHEDWSCPNCGADKDCFELTEIEEDK